MPTIQEFRGNFTDVVVVTELRGSYPNVPIAPDVDYQALIAGDNHPMFLTLPIGKVNATSGNKRHYDEAWVQELERQALATKPVGLMGHLSPGERATAFPQEAVHWVGAARDGDLLWGKGYIPPGPVRERIARYKAQNKAIATSIDAFAEGKWDEALGAYRMDARTLKLAQIDIAPADRAGIPDLASVPHVTTEMVHPQHALAGGADERAGEEPAESDPIVDKYQVIREMSVEDAKLLPDAVREQVLKSVPPPAEAPEVKTVQQIRETLGLSVDADVAKIVTELRQEQETQRKAQVKARIREMASDAEKGIKLDSVRGMVIELVEAKQPTTVQEAESAYSQVLELDAVKTALKGHVRETMGPPQGTPVGSQQGKPKYFVIPKDDAA